MYRLGKGFMPNVEKCSEVTHTRSWEIVSLLSYNVCHVITCKDSFRPSTSRTTHRIKEMKNGNDGTKVVEQVNLYRLFIHTHLSKPPIERQLNQTCLSTKSLMESTEKLVWSLCLRSVIFQNNYQGKYRSKHPYINVSGDTILL